MGITFGGYLHGKRLERGISLRKFAEQSKISPVYMCNMEKDRNAAPSEEVLTRMADLLQLSAGERRYFYDLAAKSKTAPTVSQDLPAYIMERDIVRAALRTAKDGDATDEEWQEFIAMREAKREKTKEDKK